MKIFVTPESGGGMELTMKFRHELKFLINERDKELLSLRLSTIMKRDPNAVGGIYKIRSLYFDDYWNSAYSEKMMGVHDRRKYRIRIYNDDDRVIKLECKIKADNYIHKKSASLTRAETEQILGGQYDFLLKKENPLCKEFYFQCVSAFMRPRVIVDYEREPFVCDEGDVRITFDTNLRSTLVCSDFFNSELPFVYALEEGKLVLEVKFTEFLPSIIQRALPLSASERTAVSKYTHCFEKSTNFFDLQINHYI